MYFIIQDFVKDLIKYFPAQVIPAIVGFISIPIITRLFSPEDYGNYVLVLSTVSVLCTIAGWLSASIIRFYPKYEQNNRLEEFHGLILKLFSLSTILLFILFLPIACLSKNTNSNSFHQLMLIGMLLILVSSLFELLLNLLRAKRQINSYSAFIVWKNITGLLAGLMLILIFNHGIGSLLWGSILSIVIVLPLVWKVSIGKFSINNSIFTASTLEMVKYSLPLVFGNLAAWILNLSDRYILGFLRNSQEVGIYSASYSISEYGVVFLGSLFLLSGGPLGMNIWEKEGVEKSKEFVSKTTRYYLMVCLPVAFWISLFSKSIIGTLTSSEYYEGYRIISFVAFGAFVMGLQQRYQSGLMFYKKTFEIMLSIIGAGVLNLILNFIFVPKYGYLAAAISTLVSYIFLLIIMIIASRRYFIWQFPWNSFVKISFSSVLMGMITYICCINITSSTILNLIFSLILGIIVYILILYLLHEFEENETKIINKNLKNVRGKLNKKYDH